MKDESHERWARPAESVGVFLARVMGLDLHRCPHCQKGACDSSLLCPQHRKPPGHHCLFCLTAEHPSATAERPSATAPFVCVASIDPLSLLYHRLIGDLARHLTRGRRPSHIPCHQKHPTRFVAFITPRALESSSARGFDPAVQSNRFYPPWIGALLPTGIVPRRIKPYSLGLSRKRDRG